MEGSYRSTETKWFDNYCNDNPICISSFYKQKALILDEENIFCFQTASMEPKQVERRTA